ncbi:hypothetical protein RRG08_011469 [Elysia crispata]|uniref:Uncharacterized protein n=1 Tax=Elysia crispata TaxID=231223 RepID=A0AAE0ZPH6_9GAST|nr:hypothetical protein RRG08_011469 [Elysia crispata]
MVAEVMLLFGLRVGVDGVLVQVASESDVAVGCVLSAAGGLGDAAVGCVLVLVVAECNVMTGWLCVSAGGGWGDVAVG